MRIITLLLCVVFSVQVFATIPPKKGVEAPEYYKQFQKMIQKEYHSGFWAKRFEQRKLLREKINRGEAAASQMVADTVYALTLLGKYSDATPAYSSEDFQQVLFDGPNPTGTITDYYSEISYNQLYFSGECAGWFNMPKTKDEYVGENSGLDTSGGPRFALDIVTEADQSINFANYIQYYDEDNNPRIGFVAIIHTGGDAAAGADNIWSHRWNFRQVNNGEGYTTNDIDPATGKAVIIDGDYAIQPELATGNNIIEIGVFAHEFGHIFGLPDLYDTDGSSEGLGEWCLMASGSYGGDGSHSETPAHMSAWCKKELGWVTPVNIDSYKKDFVIENAEENPVAYTIWKDGAFDKEYFLIENREKIGFDEYIHSEGLLIFHVDENQNNNRDEDHYMVDLEQADGERDMNVSSSRGDAGDPFPGSTGNTRFDISTNPNSNGYNFNETHVSVRDIQIIDKNVQATLDIGTQPYVTIGEVTLFENMPGNGRLEAGETANVSFRLQNIELVNSENSVFNLFTDEEDVNVNMIDATVSVNGLQDTLITIEDAVSFGENIQPRTIKIKYGLVSENNSSIDSIRIVVGIPPVLLVPHSVRNDLVDFYIPPLDKQNVPYEVAPESGEMFFSERKMMFWYTGAKDSAVFTDADIDTLESFLDSGGYLFLSGQNNITFLSEFYPDFLESRFNLEILRKTFGSATKKVYGIPDDYFGTNVEQMQIAGQDGANNEQLLDVIGNTGNFHMSLSYNTQGTQGAGGWIINPENNSKIFLLTFGYESINDSASTITRDDFMAQVLNFFETATDVNDDNIVVSEYNLYQNYPNPFNPSTVIRYDIPKQGNVLLEVYNILGEKVATLINKEQKAGSYEVEFGLKNRSLTSGVYLYKLQTAENTVTKKMIVLK